KAIDVEVIPLHGGSLLLSVARDTAKAPVGARVTDMLNEERRLGMTTAGYYQGFSARVRALREDLRRVLGELKQKGARIAAYGAAAKGSTLLNYAGIARETIDFVVDRSP